MRGYGEGRAIPDEFLPHISPAHSESVNFFGATTVDVEAELAKPSPAGWRHCALPHPARPCCRDCREFARGN